MHRLACMFCGVPLRTPLIAASGVFGFGREYAPYVDMDMLGAISSKGLTLRPHKGNAGERLYETPSGLMNSIGLENPGVEAFVRTEAAYMRSLGPAVIANLGGHSESDYLKGAELLNAADADILELNISCPNVKAGGMAFGLLPESAAAITGKVKAVTRFPLMVKLSPAAGDIVAVAQAVEAAGADALSLTNTFPGLAVDVKKRKAVFNNLYAGLSGPAIQPLALRLVHLTAKAVHIPIAGLGGIASAEDALAFLMAGASVVQIGTALFRNPRVFTELAQGLRDYCEENGLSHIGEIVGIV